jgi:mRNA interferase RelE/StbE
MAWRIEFDPAAERELRKLDAQAARRILRFLFERILGTEDPRSLGAALKGSRFGGLWRYRVGDHRIIAQIQDRVLIILVLRVGSRGDVYR